MWCKEHGWEHGVGEGCADKALEYLTSNGYEYKDYPIPTDYEYWEKDYGNHARLYRQQLIV